jgi:hypothetical protein
MNARNRFSQLTLCLLLGLFLLVAGFAGSATAEPSSQPVTGTEMSTTVTDAPDAADGSNAVLDQSFKYVHITGNTFVPRGGDVVKNWASPGCIYLSSPGGTLAARLDLPKDATIKYLRIYYKVTHPTEYMTAWLVRYNTTDTTYSDLASVKSGTGGGGVGTSLSAEITEPVNNSSYSYEMNINMPAYSTVAFCGVRVAYYDPRYLTIE